MNFILRIKWYYKPELFYPTSPSDEKHIYVIFQLKEAKMEI